MLVETLASWSSTYLKIIILKSNMAKYRHFIRSRVDNKLFISYLLFWVCLV